MDMFGAASSALRFSLKNTPSSSAFAKATRAALKTVGAKVSNSRSKVFARIAKIRFPKVATGCNEPFSGFAVRLFEESAYIKGVAVGAFDSSSLMKIAITGMWFSGLHIEEDNLVLGSELAGGLTDDCETVDRHRSYDLTVLRP